MLLLDEIKNLREQADFRRDKEFIEFSKDFELFLKVHSKEMNVNCDSSDLEPIKKLFEPYMATNSNKKFENYAKLDNERTMFILSYLTELQTNHFIDYERFFDRNFSLRAKMERLDKKIQEEKYQIYKEIVQKNGLFENIGTNNARNLVDYINTFDLDYSNRQPFAKKIDNFADEFSEMNDKDLNMKSIKSFITKYENRNLQEQESVAVSQGKFSKDKNDADEKLQLSQELENEIADAYSLTNEISDFKKSIKKFKDIMNQDGFAMPEMKSVEPVDSRLKGVVISAQQMIDFIKDEKLIEFPFTRESTLNNVAFVNDFKKTLKSMPNAEIKKLIALVRQKNQALRKEIAELNIEQTQLETDLQRELINNQKLTDYKDAVLPKDNDRQDVDSYDSQQQKSAESDEIIQKNSKRLRR